MGSALPKYIPQTGLDALKHYKYAAEDHSILKKLFLGAFWDWAVSLVPLWVAPNLLTFGGFVCLISNFLIALYYCTAAIGCPAPSWIFFWTAISLFIYQTLDNIDGKQARRTGSSTPLGELFDHGVDSLFLLFTGMPFFLALGTTAWESFLFLTVGVAVFYWTHWEEYHTDKMIMGLIANPTEAQYVLIAAFVYAGLFGPAAYAQPMKAVLPPPIVEVIHNNFNFFGILETSLKSFILWSVVGGVAFTCISLAFTAWPAAFKKGHSAEKPLLRLAPELIHFGAMYLWASNSKFDVLHNQTHMFLTLHGMLFSYQCDQLLLARICLMEFPWYNWINIIPILGALNAMLPTPIVDEAIALPILFSIFMVIYVYFVFSVIGQFCSYLKIKVFSITPAGATKKAK